MTNISSERAEVTVKLNEAFAMLDIEPSTLTLWLKIICFKIKSEIIFLYEKKLKKCNAVILAL